MGWEAQFERLVSYVEEHEAELAALQCRDLKACLRTGIPGRGYVGDRQRAAHYNDSVGVGGCFEPRATECAEGIGRAHL